MMSISGLGLKYVGSGHAARGGTRWTGWNQFQGKDGPEVPSAVTPDVVTLSHVTPRAVTPSVRLIGDVRQATSATQPWGADAERRIQEAFTKPAGTTCRTLPCGKVEICVFGAGQCIEKRERIQRHEGPV